MPELAIPRAPLREAFMREVNYWRVSSPLFSSLARACAEDDDIAALCAATRPGQLPGLLIFYVVHYLLLKDPDTPLAAWFASLTDQPKPAATAFPAFRDFCLERREEIAELLSWRTVNTNLPEKATCLVPALRHVERLAGGPLTLVELCCSAGLNMLCDEYHYDYGPAGRIGVTGSPVQLQCRIVGTGHPPVDAMPKISRRVGVDLVKVNTADPLEQLWMRAVLAPEWRLESVRLKAALKLRNERDLRILQGDALEVVPSLLDELPGTLCILMSYCIGHWSPAARAELDNLFRQASRHRDIHRLSVEMPDTEPPQAARRRLAHLAAARIPMLQKSAPSRIDCTSYRTGEAQTSLLGEGDIFGVWLDWHLDAN
jgi:hypothetical protein